MWQTLGPSTSLPVTRFIPFWLVIVPLCIYSMRLYSFMSMNACRLLPGLAVVNSAAVNCWSTCVFWIYGFLRVGVHFKKYWRSHCLWKIHDLRILDYLFMYSPWCLHWVSLLNKSSLNCLPLWDHSYTCLHATACRLHGRDQRLLLSCCPFDLLLCKWDGNQLW